MNRAMVGWMRGAVALAALASWGSLASAGQGVVVASGPGVIVASRADVLEAPSEAARVVSAIGHGAAVCVLDESSDAGVVRHRPGWLAIRVPGSGGVGYVRVDDIGPAPASQIADPTCGEPVSVPVMLPPAPVAAPVADLRRWQVSEPSPEEARSSVRAGRFLPLHPARIMLGMGTGAAWLREESAAQNHIESSGPIVNFSAALTIYDIFAISFAGGGAFPSDNASFSEQVVPEQGGGAPTTAGSSLSVSRLSLAVGLRTPFLALFPTEKGWIAGALYADYGAAGIGGSRSIANCVDCRSEDLDFPGGTFWRVGLDLAAPSSSPKPVDGDMYGYGFTAAYQRYQAGAGLTHEIQVGLTVWFL
jgi:hypothetical protein